MRRKVRSKKSRKIYANKNKSHRKNYSKRKNKQRQSKRIKYSNRRKTHKRKIKGGSTEADKIKARAPLTPSPEDLAALEAELNILLGGDNWAELIRRAELVGVNQWEITPFSQAKAGNVRAAGKSLITLIIDKIKDGTAPLLYSSATLPAKAVRAIPRPEDSPSAAVARQLGALPSPTKRELTLAKGPLPFSPLLADDVGAVKPDSDLPTTRVPGDWGQRTIKQSVPVKINSGPRFPGKTVTMYGVKMKAENLKTQIGEITSLTGENAVVTLLSGERVQVKKEQLIKPSLEELEAAARLQRRLGKTGFEFGESPQWQEKGEEAGKFLPDTVKRRKRLMEESKKRMDKRREAYEKRQGQEKRETESMAAAEAQESERLPRAAERQAAEKPQDPAEGRVSTEEVGRQETPREAPGDQDESFQAAWDFTAIREGEMSLAQGEIVQIINRPDAEWANVRKVSGSRQEGLVPAAYIKSLPEGGKREVAKAPDDEPWMQTAMGKKHLRSDTGKAYLVDKERKRREEEEREMQLIRHEAEAEAERLRLEAETPLESAERNKKAERAAYLSSIPPPPATRMMLCKPSGASKHMRWFWVDPVNKTLAWGKGKIPGNPSKGPFVLIGVERQGEKQLEFLTDGVKARVQPPDPDTLEKWYYGCRNMID